MNHLVKFPCEYDATVDLSSESRVCECFPLKSSCHMYLRCKNNERETRDNDARSRNVKTANHVPSLLPEICSYQEEQGRTGSELKSVSGLKSDFNKEKCVIIRHISS